MRGARELALLAIDEAYNRQSWHGTNLRGSLRGVTAEQAAWRPARGRHNIWELTVHAAYWKYAVWRRLTGEKRGSFELDGSNFFERPPGGGRRRAADRGKTAGDDQRWRADIAVLERTHRRLRAAIAAMPAANYFRRARGAKALNRFLIQGIAAHDLYHAGQIQLIKRLLPSQLGRRRVS